MKRNDPISEDFEEYLIKRASYGKKCFTKVPNKHKHKKFKYTLL